MESFNYIWAARIKTKIVKTFKHLLHNIAYMAEENMEKKLRKQDVHIIEKQKMVIVHIRNK